jgi:tetratricopeptide (TPR) repeat protein
MKKSLYLIVAMNVLMASSAFASTLDHAPSKAGQFANCNIGFHDRNPATTIELCNAAVMSNRLSPRERAQSLLVLGYAFMIVDMKANGFAMSSVDRTIAVWRSAAAIDPTYIDPLLELASLNKSFMRFDEAEKIFAEAELRAPKNGHVFSRHSLGLRSSNQGKAQLATAKKAIQLNPNGPEALYAHGMALFAEKDYAAAEKQMLRAAEHFNSANMDPLGLAAIESPSIVLASIREKKSATVQTGETVAQVDAATKLNTQLALNSVKMKK